MPKLKKYDGSHVHYVDKISSRQLKQVLYNQTRNNEKAISRRDLDREKKLKELFEKATERLQNNINHYYSRYAHREGIPITEAKKRADNFDIRRWEKSAERAVKYKDFSPQTESWLRLYNLKMRASRDEAMLAEAGMDMISLFGEFQDLGKVAVVYESIKESKRQAGILDGSPLLKDELETLVDSDFYSTGGFSNRIWARDGHLHKLHNELTKIMTDMHTNQDGYEKHWKRLAGRMGVAESNAKRLLITEERRMIAHTQLKTYQKNEYEMYVYVAEFGACDICKELDGHFFYVNEAKEGVNFPVIHPHCRCSTAGYKPMYRLNEQTDTWEMIPADEFLG